MLPIVPKGTKCDEINASVKLTKNMRVRLGSGNNEVHFSKTRLDIGMEIF